MQPALSIRRSSIFDDESRFETVIFGGGLIGFAAAKALSRRGWSVLLVETSGTLLWEVTEALENQTSCSSGLLTRTLRLDELGLNARGPEGWFFNPAMAEIITARELSSFDAPFQTLLYATPVAVESVNGKIRSVTVATKSGLRVLKSLRWIDATEIGTLGRLAQPKLQVRVPQKRFRSLVLQSVQPEKLDAIADRISANHPGALLLNSVNAGERRVRWVIEGVPWHQKVISMMTDIRRLLGADDRSRTIVSHCAMRDYPVYALAASPTFRLEIPANLTLLSPALIENAFVSLEDRFDFGSLVSPPVSGIDAGPAIISDSLPKADNHSNFLEYDVLVAGTGTAGALAALSAARSGARTLAIDASPFPGGIGTGGGINGYFYGAEGGGQMEVNHRSSRMTSLLTGAPAVGLSGWHHDAKKLALLELFDETRVHFLGDTIMAGVERDNKGGMAAVLAVVDGRVMRIPAKAFIDATGDGDLCVLAGARFSAGRKSDGRMLAYSQSIFLLHQENESLAVRSCNFDAGWVDPTDPEDLSRARLAGIAQHMQDDWGKARYPLAVAPLIGLRHSRHIHTDYTVTLDDLVFHKTFPDAIGETNTVADTHSVDFEFESDELAFYYLVCKSFWEPLHCHLPYRMILPSGLNNVWIACRAAGIELDASYGLRMQRDMQRLGEAAGTAAAMAVRSGSGSREIDIASLQAALAIPLRQDPMPLNDSIRRQWLDALDQGSAGVHLWHLSRDAASKDQVVKRLSSSSTRTTFYAAALLAMWSDHRAEPRLLHALTTREEGPPPEEHTVRGAWGQCIDYPFWLQAILLLRRCGSIHSLPALHQSAGESDLPFNVLTVIACTLEKLAGRVGASPVLIDSLNRLLVGIDKTDTHLPPSRSTWNALYGRQQLKLENDCGVDTRQDHSWQLHLVVARTRKALGLEVQPQAFAFVNDSRGFVRRAFKPICDANAPLAMQTENRRPTCTM